MRRLHCLDATGAVPFTARRSRVPTSRRGETGSVSPLGVSFGRPHYGLVALLGRVLVELLSPLGLVVPEEGGFMSEPPLGEDVLEVSIMPAPLSLGSPVGEVVCPAAVESPDRRPDIPLVSRALSAPNCPV